MALRHAARSVGVPALRRASLSRVSPSADPTPLAYHSGQLGYRLGSIIVASRRLEHHMKKELGRLFSEERETKMYGQKELEEILATIKALAEPTRVCRACMKNGETQVVVFSCLTGSGVAALGLTVKGDPFVLNETRGNVDEQISSY